MKMTSAVPGQGSASGTGSPWSRVLGQGNLGQELGSGLIVKSGTGPRTQIQYFRASGPEQKSKKSGIRDRDRDPDSWDAEFQDSTLPDCPEDQRNPGHGPGPMPTPVPGHSIVWNYMFGKQWKIFDWSFGGQGLIHQCWGRLNLIPSREVIAINWKSGNNWVHQKNVTDRPRWESGISIPQRPRKFTPILKVFCLKTITVKNLFPCL